MKETENARIQRKFLDEYAKTLDIKASAHAAGYKKQTGIANALNYLTGERGKHELKAHILRKTGHLEVTKGYIILCYLQILEWALSKDDEGNINDCPLALRALDGLTKQFTNGFIATDAATKRADEKTEINSSIVTNIAGLDLNKI